VHPEPTRTVIWLRGSQDLSTAPALTDAIGRARAFGHGDVVVDLSEIDFMDGSTVGVLLRARHDLATLARGLTVRSPSGFARTVLALCELTELIQPDGATPRRHGAPILTIVRPPSPTPRSQGSTPDAPGDEGLPPDPGGARRRR
jgi:anti-anti-sigma factor